MTRDILKELSASLSLRVIRQLLALAQKSTRSSRDAERWTQVMDQAQKIETAHDGMFLLFVNLVANGEFRSYIAKYTHTTRFQNFMAHLMKSFDALALGWAPGGVRAHTPQDKEFKRTTDFVMSMCAWYRRA